jgi:hypothetical protein
MDLWATTAETQTIDGVEYRDVWKKDVPQVRRDAVAFGAGVAPNTKEFPPDFWSQNLCVAAYEGGHIIALAPGEIRYFEQVKANMAYLRVFVARDHRQRGIVIPLTIKFHEIMRRYALGHPGLRIGGTIAAVTVKGIMDEPVGKAFMTVIGYTRHGDPLIVRWFDHFKL